MGNDNQFVEQPLPAFVNPTTTKDGIVAIQTPVEPIESRQTLLNDQKFSTKTRPVASSPFLLSADKIFALALFILLIILIAYILFHGRITDLKLNRLTNSNDLKSSELRLLLDDINRSLKSIEHLLSEQTKKTNINLQFNGQDIREFYKNQTVLNDFLRRFRERL